MSKFDDYLKEEREGYAESWKLDGTVTCPKCKQKRVKVNSQSKEKHCQNCGHVWQK